MNRSGRKMIYAAHLKLAVLAGFLLTAAAGGVYAEDTASGSGAGTMLVGIGAQEPGTQEPGTQEPDTQEPGTQEPGTQQPDTQEPGTQEPGTQQPDTQEPGTQQPGTQQPDTQPGRTTQDAAGTINNDLSAGMPDSSGSSFDVGLGGIGSEDEGDWKLILVNAAHPIPAGYTVPELTDLRDGNSVDSRIYPALQQMFDDARAQGIYPYVTSSYRSTEKQQQLMDEKVNEYLSSGYSQDEAKKLAEEWVAIPGTSEHQLGLSVDISSDPASGQDAGSVWYWLKLYCWDYGFILRYPEDKTQITGIINEPWHFRYVGVEAAQEMKESGQCLEEYLGAV